MKTQVFACKVVNSEFQAAEYVRKKGSWGSSGNGALQRGRWGSRLSHLHGISITVLTPNTQMGFLGFLLRL